MGCTVNINSLSLCHVGSGGSSTSTLPDVCLTPSGPVPVPYVNTSFSSDLANGTATVFADGGNMCAINGSEFASSVGDEPGTAGGVASGTYTMESKWTTFSPNVKMEGAEVCRLTDLKTQNHVNTANMAGEVQPPLPGMQVDDKGECAAGHGDDIDGQYVGSDGAGGCTNNPDAQSPKDVSPVMPSNGVANGQMVYVNGINTDPCGHCATLQALADKHCAAIVGIYNRSDAWEYAQNKVGKGDTTAIDRVEALIADHAESGEPLHLVAHSHGGLITSRALTGVQNAGGTLGSNFTIDTFGAASYGYPKGPTYLHTINVRDPVPTFLGKGWLNGLLGPVGWVKNAFDSEIDQIVSFNTILGHDMIKDYLAHTKSAYCSGGRFAGSGGGGGGGGGSW